MKRNLVSVLVLSLGCLGASAHEAGFLDELARRAYARGDYEQAFQGFSRVQSISPSSRNLYNIALSAELLGRVALAFTFWEEYLAADDDDDGRKRTATRRHAELMQRLAIVRVETEPAGATIFVDREDLGDFGTTPRAIVLSPGRHRLMLLHPEAQVAHTEVEAIVGRASWVRLRMEPRRGRLRVLGSPAGATVRVFRRGQVDPPIAETGLDQAVAVPVGPYTVRLEAPGHRPSEVEVGIREGLEEVRRLVAEPRPDFAARLLVTTGPVTASLFVDGEYRGATPIVLEGLTPKVYRVQLSADRYRPWVVTQTLSPGETVLLQAKLERE